MSLGLTIPLFNESALVESVVMGIHEVLDRASIEHTLVLVNNGSRDSTGAIIDRLALDHPFVAVHLEKNAGYGGGILAGLHTLTEQGLPEVIGWCWGDGQVPPDVLPPLYRACIKGSPIAKAVRAERHDGTWRKLVTTGYAKTLDLFGCQVADVNGCPKLLRRDAFSALTLESKDWFLDAEVILSAISRGWNIAHHPTVMHPRAGGKSKVHLGTMVEFAWNLLWWRAKNQL